MSILTTSTKRDIENNTDNLKEAGREAANSVRAIAENSGQALRQYVNSKSDQAVEFKKVAEETITSNPLKSIAAAAFSGLIIGALIRR